MELIYLWINNYNNIYQTGFNFSPNYKAEFKLEIKEFALSKLDNPEKNFFNSQFQNITAIIGPNGSGKSSLLSFLKTLFQDKFFLTEKFMALIGNEKNELILINKLNEVISIKFLGKITTQTDSKLLMDSVDLISFSNNLSIAEEVVRNSKYLDASMSRLQNDFSIQANQFLIDEIEKLDEQYEDKENEDYKRSKKHIANTNFSKSLLQTFEQKNTIEFISKYKDNGFDFIPTYLEINFSYLFLRSNKDVLEDQLKIPRLKDLNFLIFNKSYNTLDPKETKIEFINRLSIFFLIYILRHNFFSQTKNLTQEGAFKLLRENRNVLNLAHEIKEFILSGEARRESSDFYKLQEVIRKLPVYLENLDSFNSSTYATFAFVLDDKCKDFFNTLFEAWKWSDFPISFAWQGLSTGEVSFLTMFSRLYRVSKMELKNNIWILIDEGELYLHPEWQRQFFSDMHKYLTEFFPDKKIQLFLTSHSPFIVSDLPRENILLLKRDEETQSCKIDHNNFKSFGSNIHELLADGFFLDSTTGGFAMRKIKEIVDFHYKLKLANDEDLASLRLEYLQRQASFHHIVEITGEDIISSLLENHLEFIEEYLEISPTE